ncbi:MAG: hypothetical protein KBT31_05325 [Firmicutes bacterium]|nr:hypothetical protein [Candidatus Colimorpha enterica]
MAKLLKENVDYYMQLKNIKKYTHLLAEVGKELGCQGQKCNQFANREKANFSKMLKGERPLKYEFVIPLEKIFGVSLARLTDENAFLLPTEKENIPFDKGFRYYAARDDQELYEKEFDKKLNKDGKSILNNTDEFGKTFLDYVVEYGSENGVRYLYKYYKPRMKWWDTQFELFTEKETIWLTMENVMPFVRLIAGMNDPEIFYSFFDSYFMFFTNGSYDGDYLLFNADEYLKIIMDNKNLFKALFEAKPYKRLHSNFEKRESGRDSTTYNSPNPILNNCLRFALKHLPDYRKQAITILKFGATHNIKVGEGRNGLCVNNEFGNIIDTADRFYHGFAIVTNEKNIEDQEIAGLIEQLPKYPDRGEWRNENY